MDVGSDGYVTPGGHAYKRIREQFSVAFSLRPQVAALPRPNTSRRLCLPPRR